jgi:hypothetical protein
MYGSDEHLNVKNFSTTLQGLKPILKKKGNVTQSMPACSDRNVKYAWDYPSWSKYTSQSGTIPRKDIGVVRFHPEILEIQYQPDYPVCSPVFPLENDDQDINEELWVFFIQVTLGIKQSAISQILFFTHYIQVPRLFPQLKNEESKELIRHQDHVGSLELFILLVSVFKSVFSLTTTWIIYQSLTPFSWITKPLFQSKNAPTTAGQYNKTRLIL